MRDDGVDRPRRQRRTKLPDRHVDIAALQCQAPERAVRHRVERIDADDPLVGERLILAMARFLGQRREPPRGLDVSMVVGQQAGQVVHGQVPPLQRDRNLRQERPWAIRTGRDRHQQRRSLQHLDRFVELAGGMQRLAEGHLSGVAARIRGRQGAEHVELIAGRRQLP